MSGSECYLGVDCQDLNVIGRNVVNGWPYITVPVLPVMPALLPAHPPLRHVQRLFLRGYAAHPPTPRAHLKAVPVLPVVPRLLPGHPPLRARVHRRVQLDLRGGGGQEECPLCCSLYCAYSLQLGECSNSGVTSHAFRAAVPEGLGRAAPPRPHSYIPTLSKYIPAASGCGARRGWEGQHHPGPTQTSKTCQRMYPQLPDVVRDGVGRGSTKPHPTHTKQFNKMYLQLPNSV